MPTKNHTKRTSTRQPRSTRPHMPGYGVPRSRKGMLTFAWFEKTFAANRNYYIATVTPAGRPHLMPVWGVWSGGRFYFSTGDSSTKARNLATNPHLAIATEDASEPVILEGTASLAKNDAALKRAAAAYKKKYDWELDPTMGAIRVVTPAKAFAFKEAAEVFSESATRWEW